MAELETINVGIFGHIDHGKTTLLEKISGKWTDTHSEELKRGITIKLGYADIAICEDAGHYNTKGKGKPVRHVSFIDAPGHEMLMATMLSGAALIDAAILVVAANEGIKPQTREHFMALKAKKIKCILVLQNKIDLVSKEQARKNYDEIRKLMGKEYEHCAVIPVSELQEVNIDEIWKALIEIPIPKRDLDSKPVFIAARSFDINKPGTTPRELHGAVLGGTLKKGVLRVGEEIEIKPGRKIKDEVGLRFIPIKTKILSLFKGSKKVESLAPGGSASIETELDMVLGKNDLLAGNLASTIGNLPNATTNVRIRYKLFPEVFGTAGHIKVEDIRAGEMLMLSVNASITGGSANQLKGEEMNIGLKVPLITFKGDNVGIARNVQGHWRLIGYGEIL